MKTLLTATAALWGFYMWVSDLYESPCTYKCESIPKAYISSLYNFAFVFLYLHILVCPYRTHIVHNHDCTNTHHNHHILTAFYLLHIKEVWNSYYNQLAFHLPTIGLSGVSLSLSLWFWSNVLYFRHTHIQLLFQRFVLYLWDEVPASDVFACTCDNCNC